MLRHNVTELTPGTQLGPYRIEGPLGKGGMGQVFRAIDTRLGRPVAIKVSQEQFSERFSREARVISSLNHPHICTLYDVGPHYLVMELCDGETLAERMKRGKLSLNETIRCGSQISDALAAAHAKGVVHRDLKPHNVMLGRLGIKVLDFGLARSESDETLTASHAVMGTPAYMAPEQREGKLCDSRTDVYALGLILYEMATGKRLDPHCPRLDQLPDRLAMVVEKCLAQEPEERWQSARDVKTLLEWAGRSPRGTATPRSPLRLWMLGAISAVGAGLLLLGWAALRQGEPVSSARPAALMLSFGSQAGLSNEDGFPVPSPNGRYFVLEGSPEEGHKLILRAIDSEEAKPIPGTEEASSPFWSPDSQWIGFYAGDKLKKIRLGGAVPETIASLPGFLDGTWGSSGDIIYRPSQREPLWHIRDSGGPAEQLTELDASQAENSHRGPRFLPDGQRFLFTSRCAQRDNNALYLASLESPKQVRRLMAVQSNAAYVEPVRGDEGLLLYYKDGGLWGQSFDVDEARLSGQTFLIVSDVAYNSPSIQAFFAASVDGGVIVTRPAGSQGSSLTWFRRDGEPAGPPLEGIRNSLQPRISPRGDRVAFAGVDPQSGNRDLFLVELSRGIISRLTTNVANDWFPVWAPDGDRLLFGSDRAGGTEMVAYLKESIDAGSRETVFPSDLIKAPYDWSRDGRWIAFQTGSATDADISVVSTGAGQEPFEYLATPFRDGGPRFSPDARWIAYSSNESGRDEVYLRPFAGGPADPFGKVQVSNRGGEFPVWRRDGRELYYMTPDAFVYAAETSSLGKEGFTPSPDRLFHACPDSTPLSPAGNGAFFGYSFDTLDGQSFLVNCAVEPPGRFNVLLNWPLTPSR